MSDNGAKAPTEQSTRPDGNTPQRPSALERGLGANVAEKLKEYPVQRRSINEYLARKKSQSGHAAR